MTKKKGHLVQLKQRFSNNFLSAQNFDLDLSHGQRDLESLHFERRAKRYLKMIMLSLTHDIYLITTCSVCLCETVIQWLNLSVLSVSGSVDTAERKRAFELGWKQNNPCI